MFGFEIYPNKYFDNSPTLEKSEEASNFTNLIVFDKKLLKEICKVEKIDELN